MTPFQDSRVADVFQNYQSPTREHLYELREVIFEVALKTKGVGDLRETLKWNQPSYLTPETKSGTTIRIDAVKNSNADFAMYVHCQTTLVDTFRLTFGDIFRYEGTRALLFSNDAKPNKKALRECIRMALTYHIQI